MPRAAPLRGWYVISLRPLGRHGSVRAAASRLGATCVAVSTLRTEPMRDRASLTAALAAPRVIVTSPTAAREAAAQAPRASFRARRQQQWFALGAGTARALRRAGVPRVAVPAQGSDSEALLALPGLGPVAGTEVGVLTAPGGRGLLALTLGRRGAVLRIANVYRRFAMPPRPARLRVLAALPPARCALLLTSQEAFAPLWSALAPVEQARWRRRPCVVASARMAALASELGFIRVILATDARPAALLAALADVVGRAGTGRFR